MRTIEATATVTEDGKLIVEAPGVPPGIHRVVVVIAGDEGQPVERGPLKLNVGRLPGWPPDSTFRREEIYGDDGR